VDDLAATIARHGWAVQAVFDDGPGVPAFAYTIGLHPRLPELLAIGDDAHLCAHLVQEAATQLTEAPDLARVDQRLPLPDGAPWPWVRLGAVAPIWARTHALVAYHHHGLDDPAALPVLQVVVPDDAGRWPDDPAVDLRLLDVQPELADPVRPWRLPHGQLLLDGLASEGTPAPHLVLLPVFRAGEPTAREEAVPAAPVGEGSHRLLAQPSFADWCAAGATVHAEPVSQPVPGSYGAEVARFRQVERESPRVVLRWIAGERAMQDPARLLEVLRGRCGGDPPLLDAPGGPQQTMVLGAAAAPWSWTVAVLPRGAEPMRLALRRLERDGLLVARELFHEAVEPDLVAPHPCCDECRAASRPGQAGRPRRPPRRRRRR
jgi:hypothetical protein